MRSKLKSDERQSSAGRRDRLNYFTPRHRRLGWNGLLAMPRLINTDGSEDGAIQNALDADNHVENLVSIIERLDSVIESWKTAAAHAACDDPDSLSRHLRSTEST